MVTVKFKRKPVKKRKPVATRKLTFLGGANHHPILKPRSIIPKSTSILYPINSNKPVKRYWGDYDGDGVINGLDCEPRNRFKQGPQHKKRRAKQRLTKMTTQTQARADAGEVGGWAPVSILRNKVKKWNSAKRTTDECGQCDKTFYKTEMEEYAKGTPMCGPCKKMNDEVEYEIEAEHERVHPDDRGIPEDFMD